jgi:hypothetical protein
MPTIESAAGGCPGKAHAGRAITRLGRSSPPARPPDLGSGNCITDTVPDGRAREQVWFAPRAVRRRTHGVVKPIRLREWTRPAPPRSGRGGRRSGLGDRQWNDSARLAQLRIASRDGLTNAWSGPIRNQETAGSCCSDSPAAPDAVAPPGAPKVLESGSTFVPRQGDRLRCLVPPRFDRVHRRNSGRQRRGEGDRPVALPIPRRCRSCPRYRRSAVCSLAVRLVPEGRSSAHLIVPGSMP